MCPQVVSMYSSKLEGNNGAMARRAHITGILMGYSQFATFAIYGLVIWFGGYELDKGRASFEDMLKVGMRKQNSELKQSYDYFMLRVT